MKPTHISKTAAGVVSLFTAVTTAPAAVIFSVDMDPTTPGIQSTISVLPGAAVPVDLWATVDALGLSSFSISAMFDMAELTFTSVVQPPMPPAVSPLTPLAPPDLSMAGAGLIKSINGATFGPGPASVSFVFGSLAFTAPAPTTDALADVTVGYFSPAVDSAFDSGGMVAAPTFVGGKVDLVPEPASGALLALGGVGLLAGRRERSR